MEARVTTFMFLSGSGRALRSERARAPCWASVGPDGRCDWVGNIGAATCFTAWHSWLSAHALTSGRRWDCLEQSF